jgi:glutaredoxin
VNVIVYTSSWCPDCLVAKRFLEKHNIAFTEVDIESVPGAAQAVIENTGKRAIPQFVINGKWVRPYEPGQGFLYKEMTELLGISRERPAAKS